MAKYERLHARVSAQAQAWGIELREAPAADDEALLRVHCPHYLDRMRSGIGVEADMRRIGFPWSLAMLERSRRSSGATMAALQAALEGEGVAVNLAGGTHHAAFDRGGGYCVFNDAVVAARHVRQLRLAHRVLVIDLDVHHGNGTASLCADDPDIFTVSVHAEKNYPALKPASDIDIALPSGTGDAVYLDAVAAMLPQAFAQARADAVIYLAGADPFAGDRLGYLALSKPGLAERDRLVLAACRQRGLPVAVAMAGGYAPEVEDIVDIHARTVELCAELHRAGPA